MRAGYCMPKAEFIIKVAGEWISKAENDLKNAVHTLKMADDCPTGRVCYHAQQCIERYTSTSSQRSTTLQTKQGTTKAKMIKQTWGNSGGYHTEFSRG